MKLTLIVPCAGKSTRFVGQRPKWMLTHPNGNLMLIESINGLNTDNVSDIIITVVKSHILGGKVNLQKIEEKIFQLKGIKPQFLILEDFTSSQSETVYKTIQEKSITGAIFVKDCDNYFNANVECGNYLCFSSLKANINSSNKSYIICDKFDNLTGIVEKVVVGSRFCVGGYSFADAKEFSKTFEKVVLFNGINTGEIYISHIIQQMLLEKQVFEIMEVSNYKDWGTKEDWQKYTKTYSTIFIDLDGVLFQNSSEYFEPSWGTSDGLKSNIALINKLFEDGRTTIIITTSRKKEYEEATLDQLKMVGLKYHQIIFDLPHSQRILINDFSDTNTFPSSISINLKRNSDELDSFLKFLFY